MLKIGSHVSMSGTDMYLGSVEEAIRYDANTFMVYTGAPQNTIRKPIGQLNIEAAVSRMQEAGIDPADLVVHAPYIMNLANPDPEKRDFAIRFLTDEIIRTDAMHVTQIVLHPGSAVGGDRVQAVKWIAEGINEVIRRTPDQKVRIALETMAGKGNEIGKTFEELAAIIALVDDQSRVSVCFDTCHTHDAGYDVKDDFDDVIQAFDRIIGKDRISVFHVNDSKNVRGAAKDRHENLGFGQLGFASLMKVIMHPDFAHVPKILETPYVESHPPYAAEIKMIKAGRFDPRLKKTIENEGR